MIGSDFHENRQAGPQVSRGERQTFSPQRLRSRRYRAPTFQRKRSRSFAEGNSPNCRIAGQTLCPEQLGDASDFSGHGCGRERWRHQARNVGSEPARLPGLFVQSAIAARTGARFPLAHHARYARAREDRHLQPVLLRRGAGGASASGNSSKPEDPSIFVREEYLGGALRRYSLLRAAHGTKRNGDPEILPACVEEGAESALPGAVGRTREKLEIFRGGHSRTQVLGRLSGRL